MRWPASAVLKAILTFSEALQLSQKTTRVCADEGKQINVNDTPEKSASSIRDST